ncbi:MULTISPECIES: metal-sensing transcriptional repressor [Eubacterium]|uniref:Copper-sensing transcriptional repressor CsoR n=1 Tax=Eubacterium barkeri TaxID=1528 RepID=A0A1H3JS46_EUBBA|nr:metal-sensing transcriptional repressor [Eubacterium barkeri]MDD4509293.1 metal-sensing transcriptional repressor [Eubacteriaceae bacterium]SDY42752.1 DNA-binding transcriptional regulator, FrmR family [Eubacterium barkeri]
MQANSQQVLRLLKTARGQIDGIIKMVEEDRYCMDISQQLMASQSVLRRANKEVLSAHLKSCVKNARTEEEMEEKVDELVATLDKIMK